MVPILERVCDATGRRTVVDLCSGSGGPTRQLSEALAARGKRVSITMTDKFPHRDRVAERVQGGSVLTYRCSPVDARAVPPDLRGVRTLFNAFHHFAPDDARAVLRDAVAAGDPIVVMEIPERRWAMVFAMFLTPIFVWVATPMIRPCTWRRLLFTYLVPLVPLICFWDGLVSQLRAYTPDELGRLAREAAPVGYSWEVGSGALPGPAGRLTYLIGWPATHP